MLKLGKCQWLTVSVTNVYFLQVRFVHQRHWIVRQSPTTGCLSLSLTWELNLWSPGPMSSWMSWTSMTMLQNFPSPSTLPPSRKMWPRASPFSRCLPQTWTRPLKGSFLSRCWILIEVSSMLIQRQVIKLNKKHVLMYSKKIDYSSNMCYNCQQCKQIQTYALETNFLPKKIIPLGIRIFFI